MNHDSYDADYLRDILLGVSSIAIVGASENPVRPSYFVVKYLLAKGYGVYPVNPALAGKRLLGAMCFATLKDIPVPIDMVDVFRNSDAALGVTRDAIAMGAKVLWMQLSVRNDEAAAMAEAAGLKVIMNRCPKIEYGRLSGETGWAGINSGTISNMRGKLGANGAQDRRLGRP